MQLQEIRDVDVRKHKGRGLKNVSSQQEASFEGEVVDLTSDGRGVVKRPDGKVFFVQGAWLGERALIKPLSSKGKIGFAVVEHMIEPSPARQPSPCEHHGFSSSDCGGCPWAFVSYEAQWDAKHARVSQALRRLQPESAVEVEVLMADEPWGYRNRMQFKTDGKRLGFFGAGSNQLVDVRDCPVLSQTNRGTLEVLRSTLPNKKWSSDKRRGKRWFTLHVDESLEQVSVDARLPFRQANDAQNARMLQWLEQVVAEFDAPVNALELFAGNGNLTQILAQQGHSVTAVEADIASVREIEGRGLPSVKTQSCDLFQEEQVEALVASVVSTEVLVMDPPREGMDLTPTLVKGLPHLNKVISISCDVATWARDCGAFIEAGFSFTEVTVLDMFPQTPHVEVLSVLDR
jgi:23S rRNA (uracil1939-C5)-methyltransferase